MKKIIGGLFSIIKSIIWTVVIVLLIIILTQRVTNNKMSIAGFRMFTVATGSMIPEYNIGDTVLVQYVEPAKLKVGDDITYLGEKESFTGKIVTHRIIEINEIENGKYKIQTKGIANDEKDPEILDYQVYGKVLYKVKTISYINGVIGNLYGMYFAIMVPIVLMFFFEFMLPKRCDEEEDIKEDKKNRKNKDIKFNYDKNMKKKQKRKAKRNKKRGVHSEKKEKKIVEETEEDEE